ncbi:MAG: CHAT domain-containing protein [Verrucomicrobiia bacterium]
MPTSIRPSGITVETRGGAALEGALRLRRRRLGQLPQLGVQGAGRRRATTAGAAPMTEEEAIVDALEGQDLELVDAIPIGTRAPSSGVRRRRAGAGTDAAAAAGGEVDIVVPLGPEESAVVLVERDGVYEWNVVGVQEGVPRPLSDQRRRRRGRVGTPETPAPGRSARFTIAVPPPVALAGGGPRRRGLLRKIVTGAVVAYVLRFIAKPVLGNVTRFMERNVSEGLVHITRPEPETWMTLPEAAPLQIPSGRAARVLLLVHGTFSSTVGSFGALAGQPAGRQFLESALREYDLVLGWDHRTLSVLPTENAIDLAARLERIGFSEPPQVDAIAFSRGGLVLRSLIEHVLPSSRFRLAMRRVVFVACTNGGTELARPANWHRFADRYINLAAAGARVAALVPGFASAGTILASAIRGLGAFVKALASSALTDDAVPGIAAMDPDGKFVRDINGAQPGQPRPEETYYCAIMSDFDLNTARTKSESQLLPPLLLLKLADRGSDVLCGKPNDLVVHVGSMAQIDEAIGSYVRERYEFGTNGTVHHCSYFSQPETALMVAKWLEVTPEAAGTRRGGQRGARRVAPALPAGSIVRAGDARGMVPASQVAILRSTLPVAAALARLEASSAPWVVVERPYREDGRPITGYYAHPRELGLKFLRDHLSKAGETVHQAFDLHEAFRSKEAPVGSPVSHEPLARPEGLERPEGSGYRTVWMRQGQPVAVVAPPEETGAPSAGTALTQSEGRALDVDRLAKGFRRRHRFTAKGGRGGGMSTVEAAPRADSSPAEPGNVACQFRAETDDEYVLQQLQTVIVTIAREFLKATAGRLSAGGEAKVKTAKPLVVECMPMLRVALADPDYARVQIPVPAAGRPAEVRFDVIGQEIGPAEVRVQVRQGPLPLVTLALTPAVVAKRNGTAVPLRAKAAIEEFPMLPRVTDELRIIQMCPTSDKTQYRYDLNLPSKGVRKEFHSGVLETDPATYIADLHARIEDRWAEHKSEKEAFARDIRAIGAKLFDDLFPLELRQLLWKHRSDIESVQVLSSEPFIPWELVHLRDPAERKPGPDSAFLGELGVVRWLVDGYPPEKLLVRKGRARYVVPDYPEPDALPGAASEISLVEQRFGASAVVPEAESIFRLLETPGQFDLLHVACHGAADLKHSDEARLEMPGKPRSDGSMSEENILAETVARDADLKAGDFRPIVVLNACQSARAGYGLKGIGGFAQAFIKAGVGVFVGSSWSVGDAPALAFIEEFYARFLNPKKPETLARATVAARKKAREDGDATWLAYVVYGHPRATASVK